MTSSPTPCEWFSTSINTVEGYIYLSQLKEAIGAESYTYFNDITTSFYCRRITMEGYLRRVWPLIKDSQRLVGGFNSFLPRGYTFVSPTISEDSSLLARRAHVRRTQRKSWHFIQRVRDRFQLEDDTSDESTVKKFLWALQGPKETLEDKLQLRVEVHRLFKDHPDLCLEFDDFVDPYLREQRMEVDVSRRTEDNDYDSDSISYGTPCPSSPQPSIATRVPSRSPSPAFSSTSTAAHSAMSSPPQSALTSLSSADDDQDDCLAKGLVASIKATNRSPLPPSLSFAPPEASPMTDEEAHSLSPVLRTPEQPTLMDTILSAGPPSNPNHRRSYPPSPPWYTRSVMYPFGVPNGRTIYMEQGYGETRRMKRAAARSVRGVSKPMIDDETFREEYWYRRGAGASLLKVQLGFTSPTSKV